jgi:N6-adenosine-specific RNA methylase IME4
VVPECALAGGSRSDEAWGFQYKSNIVWHKMRKDGGADGRGVGFYFRNVTEVILFGVKGKNYGRLVEESRRVREQPALPDIEPIRRASSAM